MQSNRAKRDVEIVPCIRKQLFFIIIFYRHKDYNNNLTKSLKSTFVILKYSYCTFRNALPSHTTDV